MLSEEPVRIRRDWEAGVMVHCDFCDRFDMTVPHADGGRICAACCDSEFLSDWQNYARSLATELLSLREQRAAVKQFIDDECFVIDPEDEEVCIRASYSSKYDSLFTAAKPAEE